MAEGPQVHRIAERLRRALLGRTLVEVRFWPTRLRPLESHLSGSAVTAVEARGKHLLIFLHTGAVVHSHLMMWGRWEVLRPGQVPRKSTGRPWALLGTGTWNAVLFNGPVLEVLTTETLTLHPILGSQGPDPLRPDYRREEVLHRLRDPARQDLPLAHVLLDQRVLAGVGNIYKSEALWQARLHPLRPVRSLRSDERDRLVVAAERVLRTAYRQRFGTLPRRLWVVAGPFAVYRRAGRPCLWCGTPVLRLDTGRTTYFCPRCQPPRDELDKLPLGGLCYASSAAGGVRESG